MGGKAVSIKKKRTMATKRRHGTKRASIKTLDSAFAAVEGHDLKVQKVFIVGNDKEAKRIFKTIKEWNAKTRKCKKPAKIIASTSPYDHDDLEHFDGRPKSS
jgi:hypothetical protein